MKISDSEMELMQIIWSINEEVTSAELIERLREQWTFGSVFCVIRCYVIIAFYKLGIHKAALRRIIEADSGFACAYA
ncbi:MAG: BlaI/MecI/CopY family transcriptional regulator [Candidatus Ornithomonoglobus sp.]